MKRSGIKRKTPLARGNVSPSKQRQPLKRGKGLRNAAKALAHAQAVREEPGREEWKLRTRGKCAVCRRRGALIRHHVLLEQMVRAVNGDPWDQRNAMLLGAHCDCHANHHKGEMPSGDRRISYHQIPPAAIEFAHDLLRDGPAAIYFARRYRDAPDPQPKEQYVNH